MRSTGAAASRARGTRWSAACRQLQVKFHRGLADTLIGRSASGRLRMNEGAVRMFSPPDEIIARRLRHELETTIRDVNQELISVSTGAISRRAFTNVARMVAGLRGNYLKCVLKLGQEVLIDHNAALELKPLREAYAEALEGFAALEHALQRGYISLAD